MNSPFLSDACAAGVHKSLNAIYELAKSVNRCIKKDERFESSFGFFAGHYIKIDGKHDRQSYPLPVITIEDKGEIGFNLGGAWFEFFLDRDAFAAADIDSLIHGHRVEIYDESSAVDFYSEGQSAEDILNSIELSGEQTVGVAVYMDEFEPEAIMDSFIKVCGLLGL